ncbi:hypothetical protein C492_07705 [Natronococcus jeotgali DSM 18795]|uniref:Uncharacterized protein n=1 Tax=Natronococcus jeotgali DSM 18795 TaxID=1227498 RepID=L9XPS9_9EURY|nr:hypothetical protein C492_07705 [Natronococcus jeotgali DSM 18795]
MQTVSRITTPLAVEFTIESDSTVEHSRFGVFDAPEHTNTSCDFCGKFDLFRRRVVKLPVISAFN